MRCDKAFVLMYTTFELCDRSSSLIGLVIDHNHLSVTHEYGPRQPISHNDACVARYVFPEPEPVGRSLSSWAGA